LGFNEGVEIGTAQGIFAEILCKANPLLHLTCVDPWSNYYDHRQSVQQRHEDLYKVAIARLLEFNVTIMRQLSTEAAPMFPNDSLDFVYIDGNHEFDYVMMDILLWVPKVKLGGIIALHDCDMQIGRDVVCAIEAYTRSHYIDPWYITREEIPTAFWVRQ
jgi:predicted O-methyltransferase YrrM